jgi:CDP-paratose 2-epimerase
VREALQAHGCRAEVWITRTGRGTGDFRERRQLECFLEAIDAPVGRVYWDGVEDDEDSEAGVGARGASGLWTPMRRPKLVTRALLEGGVPRARELMTLHRAVRGPARGEATLITGGAGFIGTNLAERLAGQGRRVIVYDTLSRPGSERNAEFLAGSFGNLVDIRMEDVRDRRAMRRAVEDASEVYHFAAQVAVTTSLEEPGEDFSVNVGGTVNLLEAVRRRGGMPLVFTSTNKVYGHLEDVRIASRGRRYEPADGGLARHGVPESRALRFTSPYACSKGAADQYVLDYAGSFGFPTVVFRMSCIYGAHQHGNEDQGWVAHFLIRAAERKPISIYGDGKQVRDLLFVEDLVDAFLAARRNIEKLSGRAFNVGGGVERTASLLEVLDVIEDVAGERPTTEFGGWRLGDQRWYVSDIRRIGGATGWSPKVAVREGIERLHQWVRQNLVRAERLPRAAVAR